MAGTGNSLTKMVHQSLKKEFEYYLSHQNELIVQYADQCIVIKNQQVLGAYEDYAEAVTQTVAQGHPLGTFFTQRVSPGEDDYTATFHSRVVFP